MWSEGRPSESSWLGWAVDFRARSRDQKSFFFCSFAFFKSSDENPSFRVVKFKDSVGETIVDTGVLILTKLIFDSIRVRNEELIMEYCTCLNNNFVDNGEEIVQLLDYRVAVERCADGNYVGDSD